MSDLSENNNKTSNETPEKSVVMENELSNNQFRLKERYIIDFDEPIKDLNTNEAKAYKVSDITDADRCLFALICSKNTTPRQSILPYLKTLKAPHLLKLVEYGVVTVPSSSEVTMALIYQRPLGGRVIDDLEMPYYNNVSAVQNLWKELLESLQELRSYGITHRAIRVDNLYYLDEMKKTVVLGDCAASFPAFNQPAVYEPIASLMAQKEGRGCGFGTDDVYSLGVLGLFLYLKKELLSDVSEKEMLRLKIKKDSYHTLTEGIKISVGFGNILRNMLADDPINRWDIATAYDFLDGKTSKVSFTPVTHQSKKALTINDQKHYTVADVAYTIAENPKTAYDLYSSGKLTDWLRNSLENEELALTIDKAVKSTIDNTPNHELSVAKICIYLAPHLPIRIGKISIFPDALAKAIYYANIQGDDLNDYAHLCSYDLLRLWYMNQDNLRTPSFVNEAKSYVQSQAIGYGLDRIMYDLDEDIPCQSKLVASDYISTPTRILRALNSTYNNTQDKPYDNHIIAYLRSKLGKKIDGVLVDLNSKIPALEVSAVLRLYTILQNKYGPQELTKLTQWLSVFSMPLIKSYHNVKYQKFLEKELLKIHKSGKIYEMQELLENEEARQKDTSEYNIARKTATRLMNEKKLLSDNNTKWEESIKDTAIKGACLISVIVMLISFVINVIGVIK